MNKFNFISDKLPDIVLLESISTDSTFSLLINNTEDLKKINLKDFHKKDFYFNSFCTFSLYLNFQMDNSANQQLLEELTINKDLLLQLFFHPNFERLCNKPVLFLSQNSKSNLKIDYFIITIRDFCLSQGFDGIDVIYLNENFKSINSCNYLYDFKNTYDFQENYYQLLVEKLYFARYLAIINFSTNEILEILNLQLQVESKMSGEFPELYHLAKQYFIFSKKAFLLEEELKHLRADLNNQKEYLQLFKDQDEALKINQFYYNEYEILPLWYKKIGHLIKVLIGKRTFHSLFDSNVKKYKN